MMRIGCLAARLVFAAGVCSGMVCAGAQQTVCMHGRVTDTSGAAVKGATVSAASPPATMGATETRWTAVTDAAGGFAIACAPGSVVARVAVDAAGYARQDVAPGTTPLDLTVVLRPSALVQQVDVTATRAAVSLGPHAETIETLSAAELTRYPSLTLDESLRQHAGFELFRRSSSWVANPTSQGISLRGLGSTAASRTLVLWQAAPLNDAFGGWVHWNELAPEAVDSVTVATGGGSDLYGSSALGGVIDVARRRVENSVISAAFSGAGEDTTDGHGLVGLQRGAWTGTLSGQGFRTAGYVPVAPEFRGSIDRPANVHFQNGGVTLERSAGAGRVFVNGGLLNEARNNGTMLQTNGTRLWRWLGGADSGNDNRVSGRVRGFGSNEGYRQTFTSINSSRSSETLTRQQGVRVGEVGGSVDGEARWADVALVMGADVRDIRATDQEQPISTGKVLPLQDTSARQRFVGGFGELLAARGPWSAAASLRVDEAQNLDARTLVTPASGGASATPYPDRDELVASPRVGLVRTLPRGFEMHATAFRAFRTPTMNELYRTGQVGQEITQSNPQLKAERATGADGGVAWTTYQQAIHLRANYFWTEVNRPVSAVLLASTPTTITNQRQNLGQIVSQGIEAEAGLGAGHPISGKVEYQYAHATVTAFSANPSLVGLWIPQVPRHSLTAQLRMWHPAWGTLVVAERASGQAFDDSSNHYVLRRFSQLDLYGDRVLLRGVRVFASVQNVLNQRADVARTPVLTLGTPLLVQGGVQISWPARAMR